MRRTLPLFSMLLGLGLGLGLVLLPACGPGDGGGCTKDADCKGTRICDYASGQCVSDGDGGGDVCETDADCDTANGQICHEEDQRCWVPECLETADCEDPGLRCADHACVDKECESDLQCELGLFCEPTEGLCVECSADSQCGTGLVCEDFTCTEQEPCWLDQPHTCDGTKYQDQNKGEYPTDSYSGMLLLDDIEGVGVRREGTAKPLGMLAGGEVHAYWPLTKYDPTTNMPLSIFGSSATEARVNRVWQMVDADFNAVGRPIMEEQPHGSRYSPLHHVIYVQAPPAGSGYEPDMIKSVDTLKRAMEDPGWGEKRFRLDFGHDADIIAFQAVDPNVDIDDTVYPMPPGGIPQMREWWYQGQLVYGYVMPAASDRTYINVRSVSGDPLSEPPVPFVPRAFLVYFDDGSRLRACGFGGTGSWTSSHVIMEAAFGDPSYSPVVKGETVLIPPGGVDYGTACASVPSDYAGVSSKVNAGDYTVEPGAIFMALPQLPPER